MSEEHESCNNIYLFITDKLREEEVKRDDIEVSHSLGGSGRSCPGGVGSCCLLYFERIT